METIQLLILRNKWKYSMFYLILFFVFNYFFLKYIDLNTQKRNLILIGYVLINISLSLGYLFPIYVHIFLRNKRILEKSK